MHKQISTQEKLFNYYFDNYYQKIKCYAFGILKNDDEAQDVAQNAFLSLWRNKNEVDFDDNIPGYLFTSARWKCLNIINKRLKSSIYRDEQTIDNRLKLCITQNSGIDNCDFKLVEIINATMDKLPQKTKEVFYMSKFNNYSHNDIAEKMDCSIKTIEYRMTQALKALRVALKDYIPVIMLTLLNRILS